MTKVGVVLKGLRCCLVVHRTGALLGHGLRRQPQPHTVCSHDNTKGITMRPSAFITAALIALAARWLGLSAACPSGAPIDSTPDAHSTGARPSAFAPATRRWEFVPAVSDAFAMPPARGHWLTDDVPERLEVAADIAHLQARFTQLRYGSPDSVRVAIMVAKDADERPQVYVDANRDRVLDATERLEGTGPSWRIELPYEDTSVAPGGSGHVARTVELRTNRSGRTIGVSTVGYLEGRIEIDGRTCAARMVDADSSGRLGDVDDRLWLDLNDDGQWDRFLEQFPSRPVVRIAGRRYTFTSDQRGEAFFLRELVGAGIIALRIGASDRTQPKDFTALLVGADQTAISIGKEDAAVEVPVGRYRVASLSLAFDDPAGGAPWSFIFSSVSSSLSRRFEVTAGETCTIDPLADLQFAAQIAQRQRPFQPGDRIEVTPRLHSAGLLINSCTRGDGQVRHTSGELCAAVELADGGGNVVSSAQSGFA